MNRILTYTIQSNAAGWNVLRYLKEEHYSRNVVIQLKKTKNGILVNEEWVPVSRVLKEGDQLTIQLTETEADLEKAKQMVPVPLPISVIYEDEDLLVIHKPANMPIHPSLGHNKNTLANAVCYYAMQKKECYPYRCINRLDRDTSGLTIIAKNAYSSCILYEQMRERLIHRTYFAIVQGKTPAEGTINAPIARKKDTIIERTVDTDGEPAVTHFRTLAYKDGLSFLQLWLDSGRTHQIRVHMCHIGHPLIGDFLYNPKDSHMNRQALHAGILSFTHPVTKQPLRFSAPLPEDMLQFFQIVIS